MTFDLLPNEYNKRIDERMQKELLHEENSYEDIVRWIMEERKFADVMIRDMWSEQTFIDDLENDALVIGGFLSFFVFLAVVIFTNSDELAVAIVVVILFISILLKLSVMSKMSRKRQERSRNADMILKSKEKAAAWEHSERIRNINKKAQQDKDDYYREFYAEADRLQAKYKTSRMCDELTDNMIENICRKIEAIRTKNSAGKSIAEYKFDIYSNKIAIDSYNIDFSENGYGKFDSIVEKLALSRTLSERIQSIIKQRYNSGKNGNMVDTKILERCNESYVRSTILFIVTNTFY